MLMMRLQRIGRRHDPSYKVVVLDKRSGPRAGKAVEELGHYDARLDYGKDLVIKEDRVKYWIAQGAQPSDTLYNLLVRKGIVTGKKRDVRPSKTVKPQTAQTEQTVQTKSETEQTPEIPNEEIKTEEVAPV